MPCQIRMLFYWMELSIFGLSPMELGVKGSRTRHVLLMGPFLKNHYALESKGFGKLDLLLQSRSSLMRIPLWLGEKVVEDFFLGGGRQYLWSFFYSFGEKG